MFIVTVEWLKETELPRKAIGYWKKNGCITNPVDFAEQLFDKNLDWCHRFLSAALNVENSIAYISTALCIASNSTIEIDYTGYSTMENYRREYQTYDIICNAIKEDYISAGNSKEKELVKDAYEQCDWLRDCDEYTHAHYILELDAFNTNVGTRRFRKEYLEHKIIRYGLNRLKKQEG